MNKTFTVEKTNRWHDKLCFCVKVVMLRCCFFFYTDILMLFKIYYLLYLKRLKNDLRCTNVRKRKKHRRRIVNEWNQKEKEEELQACCKIHEMKCTMRFYETQQVWQNTPVSAVVMMALKPDKYTLINTCVPNAYFFTFNTLPFYANDAVIEMYNTNYFLLHFYVLLYSSSDISSINAGVIIPFDRDRTCAREKSVVMAFTSWNTN